ncbi:MAG: phosphocholine cytidylyltransferase family protein [Moorea sp. SIOASIH]|uniref:phosphocholine cytidylyltransferase family protein n=1 Tax=Moorena sp. SIOASIH TaxID=2607817 RepID=UPI0013B6DA22|nr:phosphocholine cytidylyltransferase family protein [Moorena sp. SIOASIH]NEO40970.1 phosphocholine cytidylyltransferase family protein [Moorena sp. SIOASIH]
MKVETAVILAAGMGIRLQELGQSAPKGFLQLGEQPIIEESIERLTACGMQRIIIVTGHLSDFYERLQQRFNDQILTIHNPHYAESGSMYSLYCARELIEGDFLLLESDLIYEQRALTAVLNFPKDNVVLLSGQTNAGDEVYVETSGETIVAMSKNKAELGSQIAGELVGISKISQPLFQRMLAQASLRFKTSLKLNYETDGLIAAAKSYPVYYRVIRDLLWTEIDDRCQLARAREQIYPAILQKDAH